MFVSDCLNEKSRNYRAINTSGEGEKNPFVADLLSH